MEYLTVYLIIEPIINDQNHPIFNEHIQMTVTVDPTVLIQDICQVLLEKIGLGHLISSSQGIFAKILFLK